MTDDLEGGCACAAVRYRLASPPMFVHCCHCRDCQRQTGSAFVINALIETSRIVLLAGDPGAVAVPTDSGRPYLRPLEAAVGDAAEWRSRVRGLLRCASVVARRELGTSSRDPWLNTFNHRPPVGAG